MAKDSKSSTVCLPFAITIDENYGKFYGFVGVDKTTEPTWTVTMQEPGTTSLEANTPYLFVPAGTTGDDKKLTFNGTTASGFTAGETPDGDNDWVFKGVYAKTEWKTDPQTIYGFASGVAYGGSSNGGEAGEFVRVKTGGIMPFRAYLDYTTRNTARGIARGDSNETLPETMIVRLLSAQGTTTAIGTLSTKTGEINFDSWYTFDGHRLQGKPSTKGIYIHNGKKVVIK